MSLEEKLSLIIEDIQEYKSNEPLRVGDFTFIEQLKQAFDDAGYVKPTDVFGAKLMTGQEWYDRFKQEFIEDGSAMYIGDILAVVRRAAGIVEKP